MGSFKWNEEGLYYKPICPETGEIWQNWLLCLELLFHALFARISKMQARHNLFEAGWAKSEKFSAKKGTGKSTFLIKLQQKQGGQKYLFDLVPAKSGWAVSHSAHKVVAALKYIQNP